MTPTTSRPGVPEVSQTPVDNCCPKLSHNRVGHHLTSTNTPVEKVSHHIALGHHFNMLKPQVRGCPNLSLPTGGGAETHHTTPPPAPGRHPNNTNNQPGGNHEHPRQEA